MITSTRRLLEESWVTLRSRFFPFTASIFALILGAVFLIEYSDRIDGTMPLTGFALRIVTFFFVSFAAMVVIRYALHVVDALPFGMKDVKELQPRWLSFIGTGLTFALVLLIGTVAFIIPGIYALTRYGFAVQIIVDGEQSIRDAFKKSVSYTENRRWELLRVYLVALVLNALGALLFLVGLIVTVPLTYIMLTKVYRMFRHDFENPKPVVEETTSSVVSSPT